MLIVLNLVIIIVRAALMCSEAADLMSHNSPEAPPRARPDPTFGTCRTEDRLKRRIDIETVSLPVCTCWILAEV
eukprot:SAG11_NODE_1408_length_4998_cov_19.780772_1_plen_74_part_00